MTKDELAKAKLDAETDGLTVRQYIYIGELESQNAQLTADNASLIQQMNECGVKYEKLITWLSDYFANHDFCMKQDMGCIDSFVSCEQCWRNWLEKGGQDA